MSLPLLLLLFAACLLLLLLFAACTVQLTWLFLCLYG